MKHLLLFSVLLLTSCASRNENWRFYGETNYSKDENQSLITQLNTSYKHKVFESRTKSWAFNMTGKVTFDYDHFSSTIKENVFTTFEFEF